MSQRNTRPRLLSEGRKKMPFDPSVSDAVTSLAAIALRNTASTVYGHMRAVKARNNAQQTINELDGIVDDLLAENSELLGIANTFKQQLVAQQISDEEIAYIINTVVPALKKFAGLMRADAKNDEEEQTAQRFEDSIDAIATLLSVEMLTVLQLVGFNFKQAIGEPLTLLIQRLISSRMPAGQQDAHELARLNSEGSLVLLRIIEDKEATERLTQALRVWRNESDTH